MTGEASTTSSAIGVEDQGSTSQDGGIFKVSDSDGHFRRKESAFRSCISRAPGAEFPPEKDRYYLYLSLVCPWSHRVAIVRLLKGLDSIIPLVTLDPHLGPNGWFYSGRDGTSEQDPLYGFKYLKDLYFKADPDYTGRYTVPVLWDKKKETIVTNESSELMRMFYTEFDDLLPESFRETAHPLGGLYSRSLHAEIDAMNDWVYDKINNGVYKVGFAVSQEAYDDNVYPLFEALDRVETHLGQPGHQPYLFGEHITEADIRLFPTIIRFDVAYFTVFKCSIRTIRDGYPHIHKWVRRLYWDKSDRTRGAFKKTSILESYKPAYLRAVTGSQGLKGPLILPAGPIPDLLPLNDDE